MKLPETGRRRLYPFEVEVPLRNMAGVGRSVLIEMSGEVALVYETQANSADGVEAVAGRVRQRLRERGFGFVKSMRLPSIPMDKRHNAKVDYPALRGLLKNKRTGGAMPARPRGAGSVFPWREK
jgi:hypothetical protein